MNSTVSAIKRMATAHSFILSARQYLDEPPSLGSPSSALELQVIATHLSEAQLLQDLRLLAEVGRMSPSRASFWKALSGAAAALGEPALAEELEREFFAQVHASVTAQRGSSL
jgi:hypothetical protein